MSDLSHRQRLIIAAFILVPALLYWGFAETPQEASTSHSDLSDKMDYFIDRAKTREWDIDGTLKREMESVRVEHNPKAKLNYLTSPKSITFREDNSQIKVTSNTGTILDDNSRTDLAGNVIVHDNPTSQSGTVLSTEALSIYPKDDFAETDKPVTISSANGNLKGVGMDLQFEDRILNLHSDVKGTHQNAN